MQDIISIVDEYVYTCAWKRMPPSRRPSDSATGKRVRLSVDTDAGERASGRKVPADHLRQGAGWLFALGLLTKHSSAVRVWNIRSTETKNSESQPDMI